MAICLLRSPLICHGSWSGSRAMRPRFFTTASSDVAGVATCLSKLGIDMIGVEGKGFDFSERPCRVVYSKETLLYDQYQQGLKTNEGFVRQLSTSVSIVHPEECIGIFPTEIAVHNRCRSSWKSGQQAARFVPLDVVRLEIGGKPAWGAPRTRSILRNLLQIRRSRHRMRKSLKRSERSSRRTCPRGQQRTIERP